MKIAKTVFILLLLAACTRDKAVPTPTVSEQTNQQVEVPTAATPEGPSCSVILPGMEKPLALWKMANGKSVILCALGDIRETSPFEFTGWINGFVEGAEAAPFVPEVNSEASSESVTFRISKKNDQVVIVTRLISPDSENQREIPITEKIIDCSKRECAVGSEKCLPFKAKADREAVRFVENVVKGKVKNLEEIGYYDTTIVKLVDAAVAGDKTALKLILDTSPEKLGVDGHAAEAFFEGRDLVKLMVKLKCLKK